MCVDVCVCVRVYVCVYCVCIVCVFACAPGCCLSCTSGSLDVVKRQTAGPCDDDIAFSR